MHRSPLTTRAVSEPLGAVILIGIIALGVALLALAMLSQPPPMIIPRLDAAITNESTALFIRHDGGDPLQWGTFMVRVDGVDRTGFCSIVGGDDGGVWHIGEVLFDPGTGETVPPDLVQIIYTGGRSPVLLVSQELDPDRQSPIPTFPTVPTTVPTTAAPTTATPTPTPGIPPAAAFTADTAGGTAPLTVRFTDRSTGSPTSWLWNFGDASGGSVQNPVHTYTAAGTYTVSLTAANGYGNDTVTKDGYVIVTPPKGYAEISLQKQSGKWHIADGTYLQFRVTDAWGSIIVDGRRYSPWPGETVRMAIVGDQQGWITISPTAIETFEFDDVALSIAGEQVAEGRIRWTGADIIGYTDVESTLTLVVDGKSAETLLNVDGRTIIDGVNRSAITVKGLIPGGSGMLQLNPDSRPTGSVELIGGAASWELR
ncbi:hypothetical protein ABH15_13210 [Methanoculleus taiwanensis]|uniref:PKD domain-containing protein n=1 Tax=Methanoculleus taiwanensis TaxID=1550565 RepID=A0A498GZ89_9EURY|nr:PKD domain-containing protein [Methanoculleus taiwanensis]RXE55170.1 hypothetical protein ABH15_13210 [Methanoculleus taiwanensis]